MCEKTEILKPDVLFSVNQFGSETYDFFSQSIRKWNIGFFQSINLEVKPRFFSVNQFGSDRTISFPVNQFGSETSVWYSLVRLAAYNTDETVEILILERGLEKNSYYEKKYSLTSAFMKEGVWVVLENICLCWELFFSADPFLEGGRGPSY